MAVTLAAMLDGVTTTLAPAVETADSYDELTEGIPAIDCPKLQVHPYKGSCDPSGRADRTTFQAGVQLSVQYVYADLYARLRSQLDEDMGATVELIDAVITLLQAQERPPFFGVAGIKAFNWEWRYATFKYADAWYMGARFIIGLRVF